MARPRPEGQSAKTMIAITAIASAALTGLVSYFVQSWADQAARRDESRVGEVSAFVDAGQEYRELMSTFMQKLTQQQKVDEERIALLKNLRNQYTLLETAKENLESERFVYATRYQVNLARSVNYLAKPVQMKTSEPVVQGLMNLLDDEVCVTYYLRDEADLEVSEETSQKCSTR